MVAVVARTRNYFAATQSLRRDSAIDRKVAARIADAASANFHDPVTPAVFGYRRGDGLAAAEHHVRAVTRRLHPHPLRTSFIGAPNRDIFGNRAGRAAALHESRMIEAIAAGHVVGVLLGETVERGTIGVAQPGAERAKQRQHRAESDHAHHHDGRPNRIED